MPETPTGDPASEKMLQIYQAADPATRTAIDSLLTSYQTERNRQYALDWAGMVSGFVLALAFLAAAVVLGLNGREWAAAVIGGFDVAAVVGIFVIRRRP